MTDEFKVPELSYTSRDYQSIRDEAIERIPFFTEEWTDHSPNDPGIVQLQLFSGMMDVQHYYLDQKAKEAYMPTVRGRRSISYLGAMIGQRLKGKSPARTLLDFTLQAAQANPTSIPIGTLVTSVGISPPVFFETTESIVIPANFLTAVGVAAVAGKTVTDTLGTSNASAFQEFLIPASDAVLDEGVVVKVNGVDWTYIAALGQAGPTDQVWTYRRDERNRVFIMFGNGTINGGFGKIPQSGATISAFWREGGGRRTNVGAGIVRSVLSVIFSGFVPVSIVCTNPKVARGGDEEELVTLARKRMPRAFRANDRGVVDQDLEALAEGIPGVVEAQALVTGIQRWTLYIKPHPSVGVGAGTDPFGYAVLTDVEQSQDALAEYVRLQLRRKVMQTDALFVKVARFKPIDIVTQIVLLPGANRTDVEVKFSQFVAEFFDSANRPLGSLLRRTGDTFVSHWDEGIKDIAGVDIVDTTVFQLRPQIERLLAVGEPLFSQIEYSVFTSDAFWEVLFLDNLNYRVYRQDIGGGPKVAQPQIGAISAPFVARNNEISFVITVPGGAAIPVSGDRFRFRSSPIRGNMRILEGEVGVQGSVQFTISGGS